nr:MAG TPA: hypothetical protein [Caudoviricetes sp.]
MPAVIQIALFLVLLDRLLDKAELFVIISVYSGRFCG